MVWLKFNIQEIPLDFIDKGVKEQVEVYHLEPL
jgi:hypothetical protein